MSHTVTYLTGNEIILKDGSVENKTAIVGFTSAPSLKEVTSLSDVDFSHNIKYNYRLLLDGDTSQLYVKCNRIAFDSKDCYFIAEFVETVDGETFKNLNVLKNNDAFFGSLTEFDVCGNPAKCYKFLVSIVTIIPITHDATNIKYNSYQVLFLKKKVKDYHAAIKQQSDH